MEVGEREIIYLSLHCHHQNDSCIKMGSDESHFNVSVGSGGQSQDSVHKPGWVTVMCRLCGRRALRFLRSQILCRLYKRPSDETINRMYTHATGSHTHVKNPVVHVRVWWTIETPK